MGETLPSMQETGNVSWKLLLVAAGAQGTDVYFPGKMAAHSGQRANEIVADAVGASPISLDRQCTNGLTSPQHLPSSLCLGAFSAHQNPLCPPTQ